ncbi:hypothetical protein [Mucilaginibacter sp. CSA2-8R]|uniref:hypothetical protein n=1 Tax=Mucilaginibacter sp. CSA2-8R TaxID=3141542 RepID=UPI00315DC4E9
MTKHTFPNQPEEMPSITPQPEIERPGDPTEPTIPQEAPDYIPQKCLRKVPHQRSGRTNRLCKAVSDS